ncbi:sodium-dependent transporter [Chromobacterium piscinae]|uniref:sodium-dependent transporter n=1 Tax=Chromobacterium piscinae TaxID=686831 RepID=UPI00140E0AA5|nr:sodium-dependent transporter [Chromobacterium piscinae]MCD4505663.1 sodium-dependent transporter [Chromobacterium piscinae]MCD5328650.1 sodium-dependent transporter [Chromobacterium piscinae]NHQ80727.1 sodium-dependent transporter [Chromobacterium vaccinii]
MARSQWGSRLGFILAAAGSAIGLGAIWKFPYVAATNGGGAFLFIYLGICLTLGLALMVSEMALGRATSAGAVGAFRKLAGGFWPVIGYMGVLVCFLILSFYSVVGGWTVAYIVKSLQGSIMTSDPKALGAIFTGFISDPVQPVLYHGGFALLTLGVVVGGVQKGIEALSKFLMPALFVLMLVLIARGLTLPGALEGVSYFVAPDFSKVSAAMLVDALGLAFFSLSLGLGIMITYGSYVGRESKLVSSALWVIALTVATCFLAGLMVLPAVFAFGFDPSAGPGLTFITMPAVFAHLPLGQLFAVMFFCLLLLAALTSSVSLLEVVTSFAIDELRLSRRAAAILMAAGTFLLGIPASLSLGVWGDYQLGGMNFFDLLDFVTSKLLMPAGELLLALFVGWKAWPVVKAELSSGRSPRVMQCMRGFCMALAPLLIGWIMVAGI